MADKRPYGEEGPNDVYPRPCAEGCRLKLPCGERQRCGLEASTDRVDQCRHAFFDNRRGILHAMHPNNGLTAIISRNPSQGLPQADPVTVGVYSLKPFDDGGLPAYIFRAEGLAVDGPHQLTLPSLMMRLDGKPAKPKPKKGGSSAASPSGRR